MKLELEQWQIQEFVDGDGHLTLAINHADGTQVDRLGMDIADNFSEWADRFTTRKIEEDYCNQQE